MLSPAFAASVDSKKGELQDLKSRIESLRQDMAKAEESKTYAADQLREVESAISDVNRQLHELGAKRSGLKAELADLDTQSRRLDRQAGTQQDQLARLLHHQFVGGDSDALTLLLSGRDPNQSARDQYFLTQLSRAKADLIQQLRTVAAEKKRLADDVRERQAQLAEIESRQQESRAQLLAGKKQRATKLAAIGGQLKAQRREISDAEEGRTAPGQTDRGAGPHLGDEKSSAKSQATRHPRRKHRTRRECKNPESERP